MQRPGRRERKRAQWCSSNLNSRFFDIKSRKEEAWLLDKFGAPYADYQSKARKLIPWVY